MRRLLIAVSATTLAFASSAAATTALPNPCTLLTNAQVGPLIGGAPAAHDLSGGAGSRTRTCIWTGPPLGYMQTQTKLYVIVSRITKTKFLAGMSKTRQARVTGLGTPAYGSQIGLAVWKNGTMLELENPNLAVTPAAGVTLARAALKNF